MSTNNSYFGTSMTLSTEDRSLENIIFQPTRPVLDSELNGMTDILSSKLQDIIRSKVPSGWLEADYSIGEDDLSNTYGINTYVSKPISVNVKTNTFYVNSKTGNPLLALVNGWLVQVGGSNILADNKLKITLTSAPSSGSREDLVFLEVWKELIEGNPSTTGKPSATTIYKYGNENYIGTNLPDEIINPDLSFNSTKRVQLKYRIRVVPGVDFNNYPEGLDDSFTVFAQGAATTPMSSYPFVNAGNSWDDFGLYVSGQGDDNSRNYLKTVDGYVYAIPMFRVHRRNQSNFNVVNQNGARYSVLSGHVSDRPDGLFFDLINKLDIEDLRHAVSFSDFNHQKLLEENFENLCTGQLATCLTESELDVNSARTNLGMYINSIGGGSPTVRLITNPNGQQRYFSDVAYTMKAIAKRTKLTNWLTNDTLTVAVASPSPTGTLIGSSTPTVYYFYNKTATIAVGSWSSLGTTTATFTLGVNVNLTNQPLYVSYTVAYPQKGYRFTKPISEILKIEDSNADWGWISINDSDGKRPRDLPITLLTPVNSYVSYGYDYLLGTKQGVGTLVSFYINGNGTQTYLIPGDVIGSQDLAYVYSAYHMNTSTYINIIQAQRNNLDNSVLVTLGGAAINTGHTIRFELALNGSIMEYDERTSTISEMGKVKYYEKMGDGTSEMVLENCLSGDPSDIVLGVQGWYKNYPNFSNFCYVNSVSQSCTATITSDTNLVHIHFSAPVLSTDKVTIAVLSKKTLSVLDSLNIYYNYYEYKGITNKNNFGNGVNSYINSRVEYHKNTLQIITNGTGAINTAETLPKSYEPLISKLPMPSTITEGDFTSTVHKNKLIMGGSYSLVTNYPTSYASGKNNYLSKNGVTQERGTNKGGYFTTTADDGDLGIKKLAVGTLIEMILEDGTKNFITGELALKVETNYLNNTSTNRITNSDCGEINNSFDLFKIKGRPLVKVHKE